MNTRTQTAGCRPGLARREALAVLAAASAVRARGQEPVMTLRLAISSSLARNMKLNDARAAMAVWLERLKKEMGAGMRWNADVFTDASAFGPQLRRGELDSVVVSIMEYPLLAPLLDDSSLIVPAAKGRIQYLLLTRSGSGIGSLADLRGRRLLLLDAPTSTVAPAWLATLVHPLDPGGPNRFFHSITREMRPTKAMLPVFFGQADACLATRESFNAMAELNPEIGKRLVVLATSPEIVPSLYAFRKGVDQRLYGQVLKAMVDVSRSVSGKQMLALFQIEQFERRDRRHLEDTLAILSQARRSGFDYTSQKSGEPRS